MTLCRADPYRPSATRKDGGPWKTNQYPTRCHLCGDQLKPGEAMVSSLDKAGRINWLCGHRRWDRP